MHTARPATRRSTPFVALVLGALLFGTAAPVTAYAAGLAQKQVGNTKLQAATELYERLLLAATDDTERRAVIHTFNVLGTGFQAYAHGAMRATLFEVTPQALAEANTSASLTLDMLLTRAIADRLGPQSSDDARTILAHAKPWLTKNVSDAQFQVNYIIDTSGCAALSEPDKSQCNASVSTDAYAQKVLDYFGKAYATEITNWGLRPGVSPGSSKYQVYVYSLDSAPGFTTYGGVDLSEAVKGTPGYDTVFGLNLESVLGSDDLTLDTVAHEYHHAGQVKYVDANWNGIFGANGGLWMVEGGAASIGYQVRMNYASGAGSVSGTQSEGLFLQRTNAFQADPGRGLLYGNTPSDRYFAAIFSYYVGANKKNGNMASIRAFWERMAANADWGATLKSWNQALGGGASVPYQQLDNKFIEFGTNNLFVKDTYAAPIDTPTMRHTVLLDVALLTGKATYEDNIGLYGLHYYKLIPFTSKRSVIVSFEAKSGSAFKVKLIRARNGSPAEVIDLPLDANSNGEGTAWEIDPAKGDTGYIAVARVAKNDPDATAGEYKLTLQETKNFAFVIDDTGSMGDEIDAVKAVAKVKVDAMSIFSTRWNWSLISFKDDVSYRGTTTQTTQIKGWLDGLYASGGGDCPEESMGALRLVPNVSPNSDAWLMTDASPHGGAIALATTILELRSKNVTVYPFILGWCFDAAAAAASATGDIAAVSDVVSDEQLPGSPPVSASPPLSEGLVDAEQQDAGTGWQQQGTPAIALPDLNGTNLYVSLSSEDTRLVRGQSHRYSLYASNNSISATNTVLTLTLPPGVSYISTIVQYPSQAGAGVTPTVNGNTVVWTLGLVPTTGAFWNQQFNVNTAVDPNAVLGSTVATATISTADNETSYGDNQSTRSQQVVGATVDLRAIKSASSPSAVPGDRVTYTIGVDNVAGLVDASGVRLTDTLPAGVTLISASLPASLTVNGNQLTWSLGGVRKGTFLPAIYVYAQFAGVSPGQSPANTVQVGGAEAESDTSDNTSVAQVQVLNPVAELQVSKYANQTTAGPGELVTYTITVDNYAGLVDAVNTRVTDTLPAGLTFVSASLPGSATVTGNQVVWSLGTLRKGFYQQLQLVARLSGVTLGTTITNTATAGSDSPESRLTNNSASNAILVKEGDTLGGIGPWSEIADATGGQLVYLPNYSSAQLSAASDIVFNEMTQDAELMRQTGSLPTPGSKTYAVTVDGSVGTVNFFLNGKPGSALTLKLTAPDGSVISGTAGLASLANTDAPLQSGAQSISFTQAALLQYYRVFSPQAGQWQAVVTGRGDFTLSSSGLTGIEFFYAGRPKLAKGKATTLLAVLKGAHASRTFQIRRADGTFVQNVTLYDDGLHGDGAANDGVYGGPWTPTELGDFVLAVTGTLDGGTAFERIDATPFTVQTLAVSVSVSQGGEQVLPGATTVVTFTVTNGGATNDSFNLVFSTLRGWASLADLPGSVTLGPDQSATIPVQVTIPSTATAGTAEQVRLLAVSQANGLLSDDSTAEILVGTAADVTAAGFGPEAVYPGETAQFTITVGNNGPTPAPGVVVTATLPAELSYVSDTSGIAPTISGGRLTWNLGAAVAVGQQRSFVVTVMVGSDATGQVAVSTSVGSSAIETNPANNAATLTLLIRRLTYMPVVSRQE